MDFGFAPANDTHINNVRGVFQRRAGTTVVHSRRISTVRGFIDHLNTSGSVTRPVGNLLVGAHANSEGWIFIPMFAGQRGATNYETLEDTLATASHSVAIPDPLIGYTSGDPVTHFVHFKGCNIGKARPFVEKFREALGDHVNVTAPLHFHGVTPARGQGMFEYMAYEFIIRRKDPFPDSAAAIAEFDAAGFKFIDGSDVPAANWGTWIPRRIDRTKQDQIPLPLGVTLGRRRTILTPRQFRLERTPFTWTITYPNAGSVPSSTSDRMLALENSLQADPKYDSAHPFPVYERLGYASFSDFFAGYNWVCARDGRRLVCTGRRNEYTVVVAITDVASGNLIFNFYPNSGSPLAPIMTGFTESNTDFFETV